MVPVPYDDTVKLFLLFFIQQAAGLLVRVYLSRYVCRVNKGAEISIRTEERCGLPCFGSDWMHRSLQSGPWLNNVCYGFGFDEMRLEGLLCVEEFNQNGI